jgi:hypothetical protein
MDKYGVEYKFDDEEDAMLDERLMDHAPYPDILAEAPGIMTEYKTTRMLGKDGVLENEPNQNDEDLARMATENWELIRRSAHGMERSLTYSTTTMKNMPKTTPLCLRLW